MELGCKETAKQWLESVGYYRLSAYWLRFEAPPTNGAVRSTIFQHGSKFEAVTLAPTQWFLPEPKRIRGGLAREFASETGFCGGIHLECD